MKQPGFALLATLSAALSIGACSMIFGIANFALFRPLPVDEPSRADEHFRQEPAQWQSGHSLSYPDFEDLQQRGFLPVDDGILFV